MKQPPKASRDAIPDLDVALSELDQLETMRLEFSMEDLVEWVNNAVSRFYPQANVGGDKRVSDAFTVRTLRYYQTLGCLDAPDKDGRRAIYGFRHYLQALMIRKLLYHRYAPESIHDALQGKSNRDYKDMLFAELPTSRDHGSGHIRAVMGERTDTPSAHHEVWTHIRLAPGIELRLKGQTADLNKSTRMKILKVINQEITAAQAE
jgi:DNA-binding transcriptional MerR regulator